MRKAWTRAGLSLLMVMVGAACDDDGGGDAPAPTLDLEPFLDLGTPDGGAEDAGRSTCVDDTECADTQYCAIPDGDLLGQCRTGCRPDVPDSCPERFLCGEDRRCARDPRCAADDECEPGEYCGADGACLEGCRVLEIDLCPFTADDREQRCNPATRQCEPLVACCGANDACTLEPPSACRDVALGADRCVNPNPCEGRCAGDADCPEDRYCDADTGRCARGCRETPGRCVDSFCDLDTRELAPCPCGQDDDCDDASFCDVRVGACVIGCRREPDNCPEGTLCTDARQCGEGCVDDDQCVNRNGAGWYCQDAACRAPCSRDDECGVDEVCSRAGRCVAGCRDDDLEENDGQGTAAALDFARRNTFESGALRVCPEDADWWRFATAGPGWTIRATVEFQHDRGDLDARLHGPEGALAAGQTADDDEFIEVRDAAGGDWFLEVFGRGVDRNDYTFAIELIPPGGCTPDAEDPGDEAPDAATPLSVAGARGIAAVRDRAACEGDVDWYRFDLGDRDGLRVRLTMLGNGADADSELDFALYGPGAPGDDAAPVFVPNAQGGGVNGPRWIEFAIDRANVQIAAGAWYLRVAPVAPGQRGAYELDVEFDRFRALCGADPEEPNDAEGQALDLMARDDFVRGAFDGGIELRPEVDLELTDRWLCPGDEDWFRLELAPGDDLIASVARAEADPAGDVIVEVRDAGGAVVASGRNARPLNAAVLEGAAGGAYFVRVSAAGADTQTNYTLRLNRGAAPPACLADALEPNAGRGAARPVEPGNTADLTLCGNEGDVDWYAVTLDAVSDLRVRIRFEHAQANLDLDVFRGDEVEAINANDPAGHSLTDDETVDLPDRLPDTYFVRVGALNAGAARYSLEVIVTPRIFACEDPARGNDLQNQAIDLGDAPTVQAEGQHWLCDRVPPQSDWYSIEVAAGTTRTFGATFLFGDDGDLVVEAYNAAGDLLATTAEVARANSKQCLIVEPHIGDREVFFRLVPLNINRILEDDERLDYAIHVVDGDACDSFPPQAAGVTWPRVPPPF